MTAVHERRFRVRIYECDAYGHVNHANFLRYMQEAAVEASSVAGYDLARYEALGCRWLVRQTGITYYRPLEYGNTVLVRTWVSDFRRATSRRRYELRIAGSDELAAEGYSDWVYLDTDTLRPVRIPQEMIDAFWPDGALPQERREFFPAFPSQPPGTFRLRRRARWSEIDAAGHVNNAAYLSFLEDTAMELMQAKGWPASRTVAEGFGIVARSYRIEYKLPALLDDIVEIATWVSNVRRSTAVRHYTIRRDNDAELLARAEALWVWVDLRTGRPMRIPEAFLAAFADNVSPG